MFWSATGKNNLCFGDKTGEISINASGGTPPYQYGTPSSKGIVFDSLNVFQNLIAGTYSVGIKDAKNCEFHQDITLTQPTEMVLRTIYQDTVTCYQDKNGSVLIKASGGTPGYQYSKDNTSFFVDSLFKDLGAGNYRFFVKDTHQCLKEITQQVTEPSLFRTESHQPIQSAVCRRAKWGHQHCGERWQ